MFTDESPDWKLDVDGSTVCELCGEEMATMHLLRIEDGTVKHTRLCSSCAQTMAEQTQGLAVVLALPAVFQRRSGLSAEGAAPTAVPFEEEKVCEVCGTTSTDLKESAMLGCANCYRVFAEHLESALGSDLAPVEHLGKMPRRGPEGESLQREILRLQRMLRELVECERFEEAAGVRDRLAELGQRLEGE